jgi:hypothetical protein
MMAGCASDLFQVVVFPPRADAFLGTARPDIVALLQAEKEILKLVHPRVGEEKGRIIVRNEAGTGNDGMPALMEIVEELCPDFSACHENLFLLRLKA